MSRRRRRGSATMPASVSQTHRNADDGGALADGRPRRQRLRRSHHVDVDDRRRRSAGAGSGHRGHFLTGGGTRVPELGRFRGGGCQPAPAAARRTAGPLGFLDARDGPLPAAVVAGAGRGGRVAGVGGTGARARRRVHAVNAGLLLWLIAFALDRGDGDPRRWGAALAGAALFALHPLRVEPVAWASALPYLLSYAPLLVSVGAWIAWLRRETFAWLAASVGLFAISQLARVTAPLLPVSGGR